MRSVLITSVLTAATAFMPAAAALTPGDIRPVMTQGLTEAQIETLYSRADRALAGGEFETARALYRRAGFEDKADMRAKRGQAESLLAMGDYAGALPLFTALPPTPESFAGITLCRVALSVADDPEVELNAALEINMRDTRLWIALGQFYDQAGRSLEAQSTYVQALKAGADHAVIVNSLGLSLVNAGRYDAALEKFQQANALSPDTVVFDNNRRMTLALSGDYDGATLSVSESRAAGIYNDAGVIAQRAGHTRIARQLFRRALDISPVYFPPAQANLESLAP